MALHQFLEEHRSEILGLTAKGIADVGLTATRDEIIESLPELLEDVIAALRADVGLPR
jgi:hypothetical protein